MLMLFTVVVFKGFFVRLLFFFFNDTATTEIYTLSLHDALPIYPAGPGRPVHVDLEVVGIDVHVDLLGFRQDGHGRGTGVDASLALGLGHPLHAVRTAFVLQPAPRVVALDEERDVTEATVIRRLTRQHFGLE